MVGGSVLSYLWLKGALLFGTNHTCTISQQYLKESLKLVSDLLTLSLFQMVTLVLCETGATLLTLLLLLLSNGLWGIGARHKDSQKDGVRQVHQVH